MSDGYEVAHVDELEQLPVLDGDLMWRPVRRRFGITAFGTNAYTADAGRRVIEEHNEEDNHQEMYVVLRGRATFTLDDDEIDAPAGTIVFVRPGTKRGAVATENGTAVLAVGAKAGAIFEPSPWEGIFAAFSYADGGDLERARATIDQVVADHPKRWQGWYNLACFELRWGDPERGIEYAGRATELGPDVVPGYVAGDSDFDAVRDDPRISAIAGQAKIAGADA